MGILNNLKVRSKLFLLIFIAVLVAVIIGVTAFKDTKSMSKDMENIYEEKFVPNNWIHNAVSVNLRIDSILIGMMMSKDPAEKQALHNEINNGVDQVLTDLAAYEAMDLSQAERDGLTEFYDAVGRLTNNQDEVIRLALEGQEDAAYVLFKDVVEGARTDLYTSLTNLADIKMEQTKELSDENVKNADKTAITIVIVSIIGIALLLLIGVLVIRSITSPIQFLSSLLNKMRDGDFTVKSDVTGKDELGQLMTTFNETVSTLNSALNNVTTASLELEETAMELSANVNQSSSSSQHIASSIQEISAGAEQTKQKLEGNAVLLEQVRTGFNQIEETMDTLHDIASASVEKSVEGSSIVQTNVAKMQDIQSSISQSNEVILNLAERVNSVDQILATIDAISGQTNLLALNAAIEAARAGEHGKGFAVVADEVRKLAEQSLEATKSVAEILASIKDDTKQSVKIMEVVMSDTNSGLHATENTAEKFEEILASSQSVAPNIEELAKTMENLNATFQTFASNADVILSISINNANNSEEVTAATEQQTHALEDMNDSARGLSEVASKLNTITQQFIIK